MNAKMACAAALILTLVPACEGKKEKAGPAATTAGATPAKAKGGAAPTLTAPTKPIKAGQPLLITWTGPNGPDDYIDVVDSGRVQQVGDELLAGAGLAAHQHRHVAARDARGRRLKIRKLVQPGPFRTDFIARGLEKAAGEIADYAGSARKFATFLETVNGKQPGDPVRAAEAIVKMVLDGQAPLRLPLGKYVVKKMRDKAAALTREVEQWGEVAVNTDFPN